MQREARNKQIAQLKQNGYRKVKGYPYLYINETGSVYSFKTGTYLKPMRRNNIKPDSECLNLPKLVLQAFANEPYRSGQITHMDGNKANIERSNIKYSRIFPPDTNPEPLNYADILTAIRCYFEVKRKFRIKDTFRMKMYLNMIADQRLFFIEKSELQHIEVFKTYLNQNNTTKTANTHGLTIRDYSVIVNKFKNLLVTDILEDLKAGKLKVLDFKTKQRPQIQVKRKSTTDKLKDFEKKLTEYRVQTGKPQ